MDEVLKNQEWRRVLYLSNQAAEVLLIYLGKLVFTTISGVNADLLFATTWLSLSKDVVQVKLLVVGVKPRQATSFTPCTAFHYYPTLPKYFQIAYASLNKEIHHLINPAEWHFIFQ